MILQAPSDVSTATLSLVLSANLLRMHLTQCVIDDEDIKQQWSQYGSLSDTTRH